MRTRYFAFLILSGFLLLALPASFAANQCVDIFTTLPYQADHSYGKQIFNRELHSIEMLFKSVEDLSLAEQLESILKLDGRRLFFHLRILSQSYEKNDPQFFTPKVKVFKKFEFLIGRFELYTLLQKRMAKLDEPEVAARFENERLQTLQQFSKMLHKLGSAKKPAHLMRELAHEFSQYASWSQAEVDRRFLVDDAIQFASELNDKIKNNEFDDDELEKGLHKLRRKLREFIYRIVNMNGFIQLVDEGPLPPHLEEWYSNLTKQYPDLLNTPYLPKSVPEIAAPIRVALKLEAILTHIVAEIGEIKVPYETLLYIENAMNEGPFDVATKARVESKLQKLKKQTSDQKEISHNYQQMIRDTQLLDRIIEFLKKNN